jgi:hypothetical protein
VATDLQSTYSKQNNSGNSTLYRVCITDFTYFHSRRKNKRFENNGNMHSTQFNLRLSVCIIMGFQAVEYLRKAKNYVFIRRICNDVTPLSCSDNISRYDEASLLAVLDLH